MNSNFVDKQHSCCPLPRRRFIFWFLTVHFTRFLPGQENYVPNLWTVFISQRFANCPIWKWLCCLGAICYAVVKYQKKRQGLSITTYKQVMNLKQGEKNSHVAGYIPPFFSFNWWARKREKGYSLGIETYFLNEWHVLYFDLDYKC